MATSHRSRRFYDVPPAAAFAALQQLVRRRRLHVQVEDPVSGLWEVTTGAASRSWGERLYITVDPGTTGGSIVEVDSRSRFAPVDWGRNRDNVAYVLGDLARTVS
jgi:hypothetical protein